jgi:hypothetical protein
MRTPIIAEIRQKVAVPPLTSRLAVERISGEGAAGQTLKKMTSPPQPQSSASAVPTELLLGCVEQRERARTLRSVPTMPLDARPYTPEAGL